MSTQLKDQSLSKRILLHGWGIVDGRLVYLPLYDPPKGKNYLGFREFFTANALLKAAQLVTSKELAKKLTGIAKESAGKVSNSLLAGWEEGDGICPEGWPWIKFPGGGGPNPDPDPVYLPTEFAAYVKNGIAGQLVVRIGEQLGNAQITDLGNEIINAR